MKYIFCYYKFLKDGDTNLSRKKIRNFLLSVKKLNDNKIKIIFFTNNVSIVQEFKNVYEQLDSIDITNNQNTPLRINVNRFFCYRNYIEQNIHLFNAGDEFIHCDAIDVYCQKNIFTELKLKYPDAKNKNIFFKESKEVVFNKSSEAEKIGLKTDHWNNRCIKDLHNCKSLYKNEYEFWNSSVAHNIKNKNIICTGIIYFGNVHIFLKFLNTFTLYTTYWLSENNLFKRDIKNKMGMCNDQGITNSIIYNNLLKNNILLVEQEELIILHMSIFSTNNIPIKYEIINNYVQINDKILCILHQYNNPGVSQNYPEIVNFLEK